MVTQFTVLGQIKNHGRLVVSVVEFSKRNGDDVL